MRKDRGEGERGGEESEKGARGEIEMKAVMSFMRVFMPF